MEPDLLEGLSEPARRLVVAKMTRRSFRRSDTLFFEGDPGDTLHIIQKGHVAVRTSTPHGDVVTLTVLGHGAFFGEQALLSESSRRTASVVALEAVETRMLHRNDFDELRREHPSVERFLTDALATQVRRLTHQVLDALYVVADKRVIRRTAELTQLYSEDSAVGDSVEIPLRQEDLATMAGTTRPTANRVLKQLEADGVLKLSRGRMFIVNRAELERRAR